MSRTCLVCALLLLPVACSKPSTGEKTRAPSESAKRAKYYLNRKDYDRAITEFTEAIGLDPKDAGLYSWRGYACARVKQYDKAIADSSEAIRLDARITRPSREG